MRTSEATTKTPNEAPNGVAVVDKPRGWTSHQAVARVRRLTSTRKVGHAGTLDPMATGVLVVGVGRATRLLGYLTRAEKSYRATIRLGASTVTDDAEGEIIEAPGAELTDQEILAALAKFTGQLEQVPSAVSAVKIEGVRSYARVRAGAAVAIPARPVVVRRFDCLAIRRVPTDAGPMIDCDVEVDCSSGTYVRALARDVGTELGCGGHLTALRRTRVGPFTVAEAQPLAGTDGGLEVLPMADVARRCFPVRELSEGEAGVVRHGGRLADLMLPAEPTALLGPGGEFLAVYRRSGTGAVADAVFVD